MLKSNILFFRSYIRAEGYFPDFTQYKSIPEIMKEDDPSIWRDYLVASLAIFFFLSTLSLLLQNVKLRKKPNKICKFHVLYEFNIRYVFRNQRRDTLNTLMMGVRSVLSPQPERPAVLFFMATTEAYSTSIYLAEKLAQVFLKTHDIFLNDPDLDKIILPGTKYSVLDDYWVFHRDMSNVMEEYGVAIITNFQDIHPQLTSAICAMTDDTFSPFPQAVLILLSNIQNFFTNNELNQKSGVEIAQDYLGHILGPFLNRPVLEEVQRYLCGRSVLVKPEMFAMEATECVDTVG